MDVVNDLGAAVAALGKKLVSLIPERWSQIHSEFGFTYETGADGATYKAVYTNSAGERKKILDLKTTLEVKPLLFLVRDEVNKVGKGKIKTLILDVNSEGKFNTNIEYYEN